MVYPNPNCQWANKKRVKTIQNYDALHHLAVKTTSTDYYSQSLPSTGRRTQHRAADWKGGVWELGGEIRTTQIIQEQQPIDIIIIIIIIIAIDTPAACSRRVSFVLGRSRELPLLLLLVLVLLVLLLLLLLLESTAVPVGEVHFVSFRFVFLHGWSPRWMIGTNNWQIIGWFRRQSSQ
jgi:hypothetical protein